MRIFAWLLRALVFFLLFAFALNNQHPVFVHGFWGHVWQGPLVVALLVAFAAGAAVGIAAMTPHWWRRGRTQPVTQEAAAAGSRPGDGANPAPAAPTRPPIIDGMPDAY